MRYHADALDQAEKTSSKQMPKAYLLSEICPQTDSSDRAGEVSKSAHVSPVGPPVEFQYFYNGHLAVL